MLCITLMKFTAYTFYYSIISHSVFWPFRQNTRLTLTEQLSPTSTLMTLNNKSNKPYCYATLYLIYIFDCKRSLYFKIKRGRHQMAEF